MAIKEIKVPDLGSDAGADVIEILCAVGDKVDAEQIIVVLESDKATMEIPSPEAGVISEILIALGDKSFTDDSLVKIETSAESAKEAPAPSSSENLEEKAVESSVDEQVDKKGSISEEVLSFDHEGSVVIETVPDTGDDKGADLIEINVESGQKVEEGDILVVLESDKATMEIPANQSGMIERVFVKVGDLLETGDKLLEILVSASPATASVAPVSEKSELTKANKNAGVTEISSPKPESPRATTQISKANNSAKVHAGPAVRRLSRELGVDLALVQGSGPKERILKDDLKAFVKNRMHQSAAGAPSQLIELPEIDFSKFGEIEEKSLSRIKKVSAANLTRSWVNIPHVTQFDKADISDLESFRKDQSQRLKDQGVKLTLLAFLVKASAYALQEFPQFNSSLNVKGDQLILKKYFNVGVAVDTPDGLVVPVIKDVNLKGIVEIATELQVLSEKARNKKLTPQEMQGGCFSISSLGGIGGTAFTPIVNWPEVAILGVSRSSMEAVYKDGGFVPRLMLPLSLSYDHRVIDGADAARFSTFLGQILGDIRRLTL